MEDQLELAERQITNLNARLNDPDDPDKERTDLEASALLTGIINRLDNVILGKMVNLLLAVVVEIREGKQRRRFN